MLVLRVIEGPDAGRRHALPDGEPQLFGRSTEALGSADPTVSRRHAEITPAEGRWYVRDLMSRGGTWLNGQRVADRVPLREGDELRCGATRMVVESATTAAAADLGAFAGADPERLRAIGETVATISHSVKNILQGLRSGADAVELALQRGDLRMAREGWPIVARNLDRVSWLAMNMLAYAKERPLEVAETDLAALVREACDLMQATAARRGVRLALHAEANMAPAPVDTNAVHQAVLNLLANAVEAAPDRTGHVDVHVRHDTGARAFVVEVQDDGAGIPAAQRARLFQPFASTKGQRGTGLGLAVARKLAEQHGGTIAHADRAPHGTSIRLTLPADRTDAGADETRGPVPGAPLSIEWE